MGKDQERRIDRPRFLGGPEAAGLGLPFFPLAGLSSLALPGLLEVTLES